MSKSSLKEPQIPDAQRGDEVYFRHGDGPKAGRVLASGKHGCTVEAGGKRHKVRWDAFLGHKVRVQPDYQVVDNGEDGCIVSDAGGRRRYIHDPDGTAKAGEGPIRKSLPMLLLFGEENELAKAIKNGPGLSLQTVTDKAGHQTKRWKRTTKEQPKERAAAAPDEAGSASGYGTHNLGEGSKVKFSAGEFHGEGEIVGKPGKDGAHVKDASGRIHAVHWAEITGHTPPTKKKSAGAAANPGVEHKVLGEQKPIEADKFKASDYAKSHDQADASVDSVLSHFPDDTRAKIAETQERLKTIEETIERYKTGADYDVDRRKLHDKIIKGYLTSAAIAAATPSDGQKPTFTILGGRGGSGKGWFSKSNKSPVDAKHAIVLDGDEIKKKLPEYEGWNAHQVHEEAGDILKEIETAAKAAGLNVVLDATMKTAATALERVHAFKAAGYRVEAHYMHLPRQEAAKRGVDRFLGETGRYVPIQKILENRENEDAFDQVRQHADAWSFRDNNVPKDHDPILISESGQKATSGKKATTRVEKQPGKEQV